VWRIWESRGTYVHVVRLFRAEQRVRGVRA
jgi:hypothetical protein